MKAARDMLKRRLVMVGRACERGEALLLAWVLALSLFIAHPACARMTFMADAGSHPILGPKAAAGAVVWSHGRSPDAEDSRAPTPSYIEDFRRQGWDAFRLNRPSAEDSLDTGSQALAFIAARLKANGYRRVVLAGQSFGAFISLIAADNSNSVDAVIAIAPAAFGTMAENPTMGALNASRLYPLLERIRKARLMLFYFADDIYDPGGRGPRSEQILSEHQLPYLVIDQPALLTTHWAGSTGEFAARFGACIVAFSAGSATTPPACPVPAGVPNARAGTAPALGVSNSFATPHAMTGSSGTSRGR